MIESLEDEIIKEARTAVDSLVSVRPYPDNPAGYRPPHRRGEVLVRYTGSDYGVRSSDGWAQERKMKYELVLVFRDLRSPKGAHGAYSTLEALRQHFYDTKLSGAGSYCQIGTDAFVGEQNGLWQWSVSISLDTVVMSKKIGVVEDKDKLKEVKAYG